MTQTITAADLATVRRRTGDSNAPYDLADPDIDAVYTDTARGNLSLRMTSFYVLIERLGIATNAVHILGPMGKSERNQKFEQIMKLLQTFYPAEMAAFDYNNIGEGGFAEWSLNNGNYS